ncbi:MAG: phospholipase D-like domain-containing protein [Candidatus Kaistia colombiensis]|nr:MAG: phospholipase D-like domain-containing protein [Kaistia sp.]
MRAIILPLLLLPLIPLVPSTTEAAGGAETALVTACFVPAQDCEAQISASISRARSQVYVQAYGFTSTKILRALREAVARGVKVSVILDKSNRQKRYSGAECPSANDLRQPGA